MMDRTVLAAPEVQTALAGFVPVRVDVDREARLAGRLQVYATPTYAVLDSAGNLLAKVSGYQSVEAFVSFLAWAKSRSSNQSAAAAAIPPDAP